MKPVLRQLLTAAVALSLGACGTPRMLKDPDYAPTPPAFPAPTRDVTGSIYQAGTNLFLFEDIKARRVGDLVTVILKEKTAASKKADTDASKSTNISIANPKLLGQDIALNGTPLLSATVDADREFAGEGTSSQSNSLSGDITVTVAAVYPNGNMLVRGEKLMTLNDGSEVVRISGIVRPVDVTPANTVLSSQIGNVEITYSGNGLVSDSSKPGWLTRFFNHPLFPL